MHDQPMEEEKVAVNNQAQSSSPLPAGLPIDWGLITGPVQPVFPPPSVSTQLPPPQGPAAVHTLQTKVKSFTQRRTRGRDREKERLDTEVLVSSPGGQISSEVLLRQRPSRKFQVSLSPPSWQSDTVNLLSSSDEGEEVEVQVRLEIHSPPAEAQGAQVFQVGEDTELEGAKRFEGQPCGLGEGTSLESLLSDNSSSSKDCPSPPPPPLPVLVSSASATSVSTISSNSSSTSSTSTRHWAPPKGFWRVARPETLLLNGVGPSTLHSTLKDYTQEAEALEGSQTKSKAAETSSRSAAESTVDDGNASSEVKHSDSVECHLDRCEQRKADDKGLCSSDSWESVSSQSGVQSADERLKVKQRAYAKLRERQHNCREEREQSGGESASYHEDMTYRVDGQGRSHVGNVFHNKWLSHKKGKNLRARVTTLNHRQVPTLLS